MRGCLKKGFQSSATVPVALFFGRNRDGCATLFSGSDDFKMPSKALPNAVSLIYRLI